MKTIGPIIAGGKSVNISVRRGPLEKNKPYTVDLVAECEGETRESRISWHPKHEKTTADFQKDIDRAAQKLAEETVGHLKAKTAIDSILTEK